MSLHLTIKFRILCSKDAPRSTCTSFSAQENIDRRIWLNLLYFGMSGADYWHEDPHTTLFFCTPQDVGVVKARVLKTLGFQPQAIKKQYVSSPFGPIISGQLFDKAFQFLTNLRWHLPGNRAYPRVIQNNRA